MAVNSLCSINNCGKRVHARALCQAHYRKLQKYSDPLASAPRAVKTIATCIVDGCDNVEGNARGMCTRHYSRWRRYGDPHACCKAGGGDLQRFIKNIAAPYDGDDCLIWPFARTPEGYGKAKHNGTHHNAHRLVCLTAHGAAPSSSHVAAHSCGRGHYGCVNPRHLRWATPAENSADKIKHGTQQRGERHPRAKLSEPDVIEIRNMRGTISSRDLAERYGVSPSTIGMIQTRRIWGWL